MNTHCLAQSDLLQCQFVQYLKIQCEKSELKDAIVFVADCVAEYQIPLLESKLQSRAIEMMKNLLSSLN